MTDSEGRRDPAQSGDDPGPACTDSEGQHLLFPEPGDACEDGFRAVPEPEVDQPMRRGPPPKFVRTVRQLIYWEYAKFVAGIAVADRRAFAFARYTFNRLLAGQIEMSAIVRENKFLMERGPICAYCGVEEGLQWEHVIPKSRG
jgi:hypothetical protein